MTRTLYSCVHRRRTMPVCTPSLAAVYAGIDAKRCLVEFWPRRRGVSQPAADAPHHNRRAIQRPQPIEVPVHGRWLLSRKPRRDNASLRAANIEKKLQLPCSADKIAVHKQYPPYFHDVTSKCLTPGPAIMKSAGIHGLKARTSYRTARLADAMRHKTLDTLGDLPLRTATRAALVVTGSDCIGRTPAGARTSLALGEGD